MLALDSNFNEGGKDARCFVQCAQVKGNNPLIRGAYSKCRVILVQMHSGQSMPSSVAAVIIRSNGAFKTGDGTLKHASSQGCSETNETLVKKSTTVHHRKT